LFDLVNHRIKWPSLLSFVIAILVPSTVTAEIRWSISPTLGVYSPDLGPLNDKVFGARLPLSGDLFFQDDGANERPVRYDVDNPLPKIRYGAEAGVEFRMEIDQRNHFVIGLSSWEGVSTARVNTTLPFQGALTDTVYTRRASIAYLQYYLGWRRDLIKRHKKFTFYSRILLNEVFDIDFRESFVFEFNNSLSEGDTFKRITRLETQATGSLMLQPAIGGEFFIRDWLSLGIDLGYAFGLNSFELGNANSSNDFQPRDRVSISYPTGGLNDGSGKLGYLADEDGAGYRKMEIDLNGWRTLFKINIYY